MNKALPKVYQVQYGETAWMTSNQRRVTEDSP